MKASRYARLWPWLVLCVCGCTFDTAPVVAPETARSADEPAIPGGNEADDPVSAAATGDEGAPAEAADEAEGTAGAAGTDDPASDGEEASSDAPEPAPGDEGEADPEPTDAQPATEPDPIDATDPADPTEPDPAAAGAPAPEPEPVEPPARFASACSADQECALDEVCVRGGGLTTTISYCAQTCDQTSDCEPGPGGESAVCTAGFSGGGTCRLPCDFVVDETCPGDMVCQDAVLILPAGTGTCGYRQ